MTNVADNDTASTPANLEAAIRANPGRWPAPVVATVRTMRRFSGSPAEWSALLDEVSSALRPVLRVEDGGCRQ